MKNKRRKLLKTVALGGGAVSLSQLPTTWTTPVVQSVALPAHAQTTAPDGSTLVRGGGGSSSTIVQSTPLLDRFVPEAYAVGSDYPGCVLVEWRLGNDKNELQTGSVVLVLLSEECPDPTEGYEEVLSDEPMNHMGGDHYQFDDGVTVNVHITNPLASHGEMFGWCQVNSYNPFDLYRGSSCTADVKSCKKKASKKKTSVASTTVDSSTTKKARTRRVAARMKSGRKSTVFKV